ncbi:MAG: YopX family protein [Bacteroidales bacterium]|nr:YopX family protein [Bacteroidales bacterium]
MEREILFRGKRIDNGEFAEGLLIEDDGYYYIYRSFGVCPNGYDYLKSGGATVGFYVRVIPETVGQFTGLTDKNGNKIFEGDIVNIPDLEFVDFVDNGTSSPDEKYEDGIVEIFFDEGVFCFNHPNTDTPCPIFYNIKETEIIGNIHDNPGLLKQERR